MKKHMTIVVAGLAVAMMVGSAAQASTVTSALQLAAIKKAMDDQLNAAPYRARAIVKYGLMKKGKKLGDGQCTVLINYALTASNSRPGNFSDPVNYNWGTKRSPGAAIQCGDIIQFEDALFRWTTTSANGSTRTEERTMPHHSAIVRFVKGKTVVLLHQNLDGSPVMETVLDLSKLKEGRYSVWCAVAK